MKITYVSAKLFIVLVKISLPLIQEIIMLILHVVNNALNSFTEKENYYQKMSYENNLPHQIFSTTGCAWSHFTFANSSQCLLSNISKQLKRNIFRNQVGVMSIQISFILFISVLSQLELTENSDVLFIKRICYLLNILS